MVFGFEGFAAGFSEGMTEERSGAVRRCLCRSLNKYGGTVKKVNYCTLFGRNDPHLKISTCLQRVHVCKYFIIFSRVLVIRN